MRRLLTTFIVLMVIALPRTMSAAPLCSDGTPAPGDNICNCASAASIGGSTFVPGSNSGLTGNTYGGIQFGGVGGALMSCLGVGSAISGAASSLFGTESGSEQSSTVPAVPIESKGIEGNTNSIKKEEEKTTKREQCLNGAAYAVAKTALQKVSDKTLNWVKTGFNGNPFYVRNIDSYLKSIENEKLDTYLNKYVQTSNPVFGNALRSVLKQQATGYSDGFLNKAMNTPEGRAYQDFQSDFTKGGWNAFLNPQNNPVGAYFNATDQLNNIIQNAQQNVKDELQQGSGFLSMKKCVEYEPITNSGPRTCNGGIPEDELLPGTTCVPDQPNTPAAIGKKPSCIRYETVTPGSLISSQVSKVTNSTVDQLLGADQINEVLGNFFDQLLNRLFSEGLTGSGRGSTSATTPGGYGTNVVIGSNGQTLASATACQTPLGYNATTGGFDDEFDISRPQQLRAIIRTQKTFLTYSQDAQYKMQELVPQLGALDYCMPGPNPTWNNNLNENTQTFVSLLQEVREKDNNVLVLLNNILDPGNILCSVLGDISSNCTNEVRTVGYGTSRISLFDKVDYTEKRISDRAYKTGINQTAISAYFSDVLEALKTNHKTLYSESAITNAFVALATTPAAQTFYGGQIKEAYRETGNLVGYAQGIAAYNAQYNTNIKTTAEALIELEDIYNEVQRIVAPAKARYIAEQAVAPNTPVNLSCINNAYQLGPIGNGEPHLEDITGAPDPDIQKSINAGIYFYSRL